MPWNAEAKCVTKQFARATRARRNPNRPRLSTESLMKKPQTPSEMGRKGGKMRAKRLTAAQLSAIGRKAGIASGKARAAVSRAKEPRP